VDLPGRLMMSSVFLSSLFVNRIPQPQPAGIAGPEGGNAALANALRAAVAQGDARIGELESAREYSANDRYCVYLRERSRSALAVLPEGDVQRFAADHGPADNSALTPQSMVQHCASCHGGSAAPPLPFDRPQLLAPLLRLRAAAHGDLLGEILFRLSLEAGAARMPRDANLAPAQREALSRYLVSLAKAP
jgi:mono/diheme cytochrome c family protein